jgi:UTP-glucose-1-phosphate uridylyltransferase
VKAVFPVAGLGTRFLPATKASPKEMLPIVDRPLIQYAAEEAVAAGIKELIFVTGRAKRSIEDHFDKANIQAFSRNQCDGTYAADWVHLGTLGTRGGELAATIPD